jgi:hypothetical protein
MALKRINLNDVFKFVSVYDEAIDKEKSDLDAFLKDRDYKKLVFKENQQPTIFLIKNISVKKEKEIREGHFSWQPQGTDKDGKPVPPKIVINDEIGLLIKYFEACVHEIEEYQNGQWVKSKTSVDEWSTNIVIEIGSFIMTRNTLSDTEKK